MTTFLESSHTEDEFIFTMERHVHEVRQRVAKIAESLKEQAETADEMGRLPASSAAVTHR